MKTSETDKFQSQMSSETRIKLRIKTNGISIRRCITAARRRLSSAQLQSGEIFITRENRDGVCRYQGLMSAVLNPIAPIVFVLLMTLSVSGQQSVISETVGENTAFPAAASTNDAYRIGSGDVLEVRVFNRPQLSRDAVRVDDRGLIRMPLIDVEIRAACRTESELAAQIANLYLPLQRHPQVDVFIKEYSSRPVAVVGAVDKPGQFQLQRSARLLELVSLAGGPTERAGLRIFVAHTDQATTCDDTATRSATGFESFDLNQTLKGEALSNPYVRAGDVVTIPEAQQVFVVGDVFRPMSIPLKEKVTLSQAVAMAGGVMPDAKKENVRILRQAPGAATKTEIVADLNAISKRKADDPELIANDIVEVPTSTGKRILRGLISAVAPAASSLPVRVVR